MKRNSKHRVLHLDCAPESKCVQSMRKKKPIIKKKKAALRMSSNSFNYNLRKNAVIWSQTDRNSPLRFFSSPKVISLLPALANHFCLLGSLET